MKKKNNNNKKYNQFHVKSKIIPRNMANGIIKRCVRVCTRVCVCAYSNRFSNHLLLCV